MIKDLYSYLHEDLIKINEDIIKFLGNDSKIRLISDYVISAGGKRLRPILVLLASRLFNYQGIHHIKIAAAVELIHTATLLHDDVVDDSNTRRGKTTANQKWGNKYAVLVGDYLLSNAFRLMVASQSLEALDILSKSSSLISEGEVIQLNKIGDINLTFDDYIEIISKKTAELFAVSCQLGAVLCEQNHETSKKMYELGLNAGISFQIIDDLLDYTADENILGKKLGDDFTEKKVTLPFILLQENADSTDSGIIRRIFDQGSITGLEQILEMFNKYNIPEKTKEIAKKYLSRSLEILNSLECVDDEPKIFLYNLIKKQGDRLF